MLRNGANELNHSAADFSGKSLDLRNHDASLVWEIIEMEGGASQGDLIRRHSRSI